MHTAFGHPKPQPRFCVAALDQTVRAFFTTNKYDEQSSNEIIRAPSHVARTDVDGKYTLILQDKKNFENKTVCILDAGVGVLPIIAARSGAKMVYAVESSALRDTMEVLVKDNGHDIQSRINIVKDIDDIDVKVDVILISPMGILCLHGNYLSKLVKARDKLLNSDGVVVPKSLKILTAPLFDEKTTKYLRTKIILERPTFFWG